MTFIVPGEPRGKGRPRFTKSGSVYTDGKTKQYEFLIQLLSKQGMRGELPYEGTCGVTITAYYPIPKRASYKKAAAMGRGEILPPVKPDADNIAKIILDGMNGIVFKDDKQVTDLHVFKKYGAIPRVEVTCEEVQHGLYHESKS